MSFSCYLDSSANVPVTLKNIVNYLNFILIVQLFKDDLCKDDHLMTIQ